jgi:hypothetical protein
MVPSATASIKISACSIVAGGDCVPPYLDARFSKTEQLEFLRIGALGTPERAAGRANNSQSRSGKLSKGRRLLEPRHLKKRIAKSTRGANSFLHMYSLVWRFVLQVSWTFFWFTDVSL